MLKIFSWGNTLDPRFRGGGRGERGGKRGRRRIEKVGWSFRKGEGRGDKKKGRGREDERFNQERNRPPAVGKFLDSILYTSQ